MEKITKINLLANKDDRFGKMLPMFQNISQNGYGKLTDRHFIIPTTITFQPLNEEFYILTMLQQYSAWKGYNINCFCLK